MSSMTRPAVLVMLSATILAACSTTSEKSVLVEPPRIATGILESYRCPPMPRLDITTATARCADGDPGDETGRLPGSECEAD